MEIKLIDEGNDDDFGAAEYSLRAPQTEQERQHYARAKELQAKFRSQATAHYVRLADDLVEAFPTPEAVNDALRRVLREMQRAA
jgi:hypothetical protein